MPLKERVDDYFECSSPGDGLAGYHYEEGFTEALELCCKWVKEHTDDYGALHGAEIEMEKDILEGNFPYNDEEE